MPYCHISGHIAGLAIHNIFISPSEILQCNHAVAILEQSSSVEQVSVAGDIGKGRIMYLIIYYLMAYVSCGDLHG